jgi:hypothetical protein
MTILRAGVAGIVLAAALAATADAQPYYPQYYGYPYPAYRYPRPAYGYGGYPGYWGRPAYYGWAPPAWVYPYAFWAPYSAKIGPKVDGDTHY